MDADSKMLHADAVRAEGRVRWAEAHRRSLREDAREARADRVKEERRRPKVDKDSEWEHEKRAGVSGRAAGILQGQFKLHLVNFRDSGPEQIPL